MIQITRSTLAITFRAYAFHQRHHALQVARGDGGKSVFEDDKDRYGWVDLLERACERFAWRVHAWVLMGRKGSVGREAVKAHDETEADRIATASLALLGLPDDAEKLAGRGRWLQEKTVIAAVIRKRTGVGNRWIARRLGMGQERSVIRAVRRTKEDAREARTMLDLENRLVADYRAPIDYRLTLSTIDALRPHRAQVAPRRSPLMACDFRTLIHESHHPLQHDLQQFLQMKKP